MTGTRQHLRFLTQKRVELTADDRNDLRQVWMTDISKGGLFIATDTPPPLRTRMTVVLATPDGTVELSAEVVHIVDSKKAEALGTPCGIGLHFVDLSEERRAAIEAYVEGLVADLVESNGPLQTDDDDGAEAVVALMKKMLDAFEREDLYETLGIEPNAAPQAIRDRTRQLADQLGEPPQGLNATQASRVLHIRSLVLKVGALLSDPDRRLDYDLRHGHIFAAERMAAADQYERARLRRMWHRLHADALAAAKNTLTTRSATRA